MGKNTVKKIGNERSKKNLTAGMAARNNIGNEKQMKQSISHRPHLSYRKNLAAHRSTPAKKLSALERFNRFKALRDKNLKRQVKKILPAGKVKIKTPKKTDKTMATETIVNGSHDETKTEKNETSIEEVIANIKLKTPVVELQKETFAAENTNGVEENTVIENDKEERNGHDNGIEGDSETETNVEKPSPKLRQMRKSKTNDSASKSKEKAKQKRDSKSVTPTRRVSKRIKRNEEERDSDLSVVENDSSTDVNNTSKDEMNDSKEHDDVPTDISLSLEHESTPFENDVEKEPYEGEEDTKGGSMDSPFDEVSMDTSESKTSIHEKSDNILEENDSAVGSSHDFSLSFNEYEEEREGSANNAVASSSVFSMIRRSLRKETRPKMSPAKKPTPEPCTSNVRQYESSSEIKIPTRNMYSGICGRKPLRPTSMYNSYYKTKSTEGTNHYSLKRKSSDIDNYFDSTERKRFSGDVGNTTLSEKSPGWKFFSSPFNRFWSPKEENTDTSVVKSSTPYQKRETSYSVEESMVVNYNEETVAKSTVGTTHIDMEESKMLGEEGKPSSLVNKYCVIM